MAYTDSGYYTGTFCGDVIPADQQVKYLQRASDDIDSMTYNRIARKGFSNLKPLQQVQIQKAVCYQAEHLYNYGDMAMLGVSSYNVNGMSVNMGANNRYSAQAREALMPTGLLNRGFSFNETALF
jgi:hypothetical protein